MPVGAFITGPYSATYNAVGVGLSKDGYRIMHDFKAEVIDKSDLYGDTMLDYITRGANVMCNFTLIEFNKGTPILNPYTAALYRAWATATPVGRLGSDLAQAFVMTVVANTTAAGAGLGPASITAGKAILAPNYSAEHLYDARLRDIPLRMQFLPYDSSGNLVFAVTT